MLLFLIILITAGTVGCFIVLRMKAAQNPPAEVPAEESAENRKDPGPEPSPAEKAGEESGETKGADPAQEQKEKDAAEKAEADKWKQDSFASGAETADPEKLAKDTEIPEEIRAFVAKYPEAAEFAANYAEYADQHLPVDISTEVAADGLPMFLQWDPRWGYETYGGGFMGVRGCGPTCLSMVLSGLTGHTEWNPFRTAQYADENGYYLENVGSEWGLMQKGAADLGLTVSEVSASGKGIEEALNRGEPVICAMGPGDFTYSGHFIVLCSIDGQGAITIHDPNSRINSERTWTAEELVPQIKALWSYRVEVPEAETEEVPPEESENA